MAVNRCTLVCGLVLALLVGVCFGDRLSKMPRTKLPKRDGQDTTDDTLASMKNLVDVAPLTEAMQSHIGRFKQLRDELKNLQEDKGDKNPLQFFRDTMRLMDGLKNLGAEWKDIERLQNNRALEFEKMLEGMDPLCGQPNHRTAWEEAKLTCSYSTLQKNPIFLIGPLKLEVAQHKPDVMIFRDFLTETEVRRANETRQIERTVRQRVSATVNRVFGVAVREVSKNGYNGSMVQPRGFSLIIYLETQMSAGVTLFPGGRFGITPTAGSMVVSKMHPSVCPSRKPVNIISNFNVLDKTKNQ
uniref:Uncharacterized protein n=1 Tax=Anopheles atroparvus TaxID=41427 RepID=A0A182JA12_ANOAO